MKKKFRIGYLRALVQLISFLLVPGIFALAFSQIGTVVSAIIKGNGNESIIIINLLLPLSLIILTIIFGRFFCGWICSFGAMNDLLYYISKKLFKVKIVIPEKTEKYFKLLKYLVLLYIIVVFWILSINIGGLNPWKVFANIIKFPPIAAVFSIGFILLIFIIIGSMLIERFFCRYLCPLGAIFAIFSKVKLVNISKERANCGNCKACTVKCSMGLALYKEDKVKELDCINCLKCIDVCPKNNANLTIKKKVINPIYLTAIFLIVFVIFYFMRDEISNKVIKNYNKAILSKKATVEKTTTQVISKPTENLYKDGSYIGTGKGYNSNVEVKVTIDNGKISAVNVVSIGDSPSYEQQAVAIIPTEIINAQSTKVDVVAGATESSMGIIDAAKNALLKAIGGKNDFSNNNELKNTLTNNSQAVNFPTKTITATAGNSRATVKITLDGEMIENIEILNLISNEQGSSKAKEIIPQEILSNQSTNVAIVKAAPNSSKAIILAVNKAIQ